MISSPINLRQVHHLVVLAQLKSYVRAADALGVTQSALSRSIQALEAHYDVRLLDRDRGGVRLTPSGQEIIAEAEGLLNRAAELSRKLVEVEDGSKGRVAFGCAPYAAVLILPQLMPDLIKRYPQLRMRVEVLNSDALLGMLDRGEIEFALCGDRQVPPDARVEIKRLRPMNNALLVRRGHPLANRAEVPMSDVWEFPTVSGFWGGQFAVYGPTDKEVPTVSCDDFRTLLAMTLDSDAVWLGPSAEWLSADETKDLVEIKWRPSETQNDMRLVILTSTRRTSSAQARLLVDHLGRTYAAANVA
jgi:DNA-binding transcriptional LysR family regulator